MTRNRNSGILCHPTSLPGGHGIGDLGEGARTFVRWLESAGQHIWQVLPLGPTGYGDAPYTCSSAFASNPLLIDLTQLEAQGYTELPAFPENTDRVDFQKTREYKMSALKKAFQVFAREAHAMERHAFLAYRAAPENSYWLEDFALFTALKESFGGKIWTDWPEALKWRDPAAIARWIHENEETIEFHVFCQWLFSLQWTALKTYANKRGVQICGDIPIFVAFDSSDVWANPTLFHLDHDGSSTHVAGVPPDYFSETGQRWGNPLYRWNVMARDGYRWWMERLKSTFRQVDVLRIDHFRGFAAYWAIPAGEETAINGQWVQGPGAHFFAAVQQQLGDLPLIAEDLGTITPDVLLLRDRFNLPGMKILQFAFGDPKNAYLPHNFSTPNCVVYTGTHDNDTTKGWWNSSTESEQKWVLNYLGEDEDSDFADSITWTLIRTALNSSAYLALFPIQDILNLGSEARMNTPGEVEDNWMWRLSSGQLTEALAQKLHGATYLSGRTPTQPKEDQSPADKS